MSFAFKIDSGYKKYKKYIFNSCIPNGFRRYSIKLTPYNKIQQLTLSSNIRVCKKIPKKNKIK